MATEWPWATSEIASPEPTRPQPTTITCTPQHNTRRAVVQREAARGGRRFLLRWRRGAQSRSSASGSVVGAGGRHNPRATPVPIEEQVARAAAGDRTAELGASGPTDRLGGAGPRLHLVLGLRHRGDAHPVGAGHRTGRLQPAGPHHPGHHRCPLLRDALVPRRHQVLYEGRRGLRGGPRQLRAENRPDRRGGAVDRLHRHGRRPDVGRNGRPDECRPELGQHLRHRGHHRRGRPAAAVREPARHPRGREVLRRPHLLLRGRPGHRHHRRLHQRGDGQPAPDAPPTRGRALRWACGVARAKAG